MDGYDEGSGPPVAAPSPIPAPSPVTRVLTFAVGAMVAGAVLFALVPAYRTGLDGVVDRIGAALAFATIATGVITLVYALVTPLTGAWRPLWAGALVVLPAALGGAVWTGELEHPGSGVTAFSPVGLAVGAAIGLAGVLAARLLPAHRRALLAAGLVILALAALAVVWILTTEGKGAPD